MLRRKEEETQNSWKQEGRGKGGSHLLGGVTGRAASTGSADSDFYENK